MLDNIAAARQRANDALNAVFNHVEGLLRLHELERTGEWQNRRLELQGVVRQCALAAGIPRTEMEGLLKAVSDACHPFFFVVPTGVTGDDKHRLALALQELVRLRVYYCESAGIAGGEPQSALIAMPAGANAGEGKPKGKGGKPPLEKSANEKDKLKLQVYGRIRKERNAGLLPKKILEKLKGDNSFKEQVKEAGLTLNRSLLNAARAFFGQPNRKMKETQPS